MTMNTHYSGRLQRAVEKVVSEAPETFYKIFNKYDYYDVADKNNGLTEEQRNQVPEQNQTRFTQLSYVIADMFDHMLGGDDGLLSNYTQEIIDKLDARASCNASQLQVLGGALSALPPLAPINGAMKTAESQTAAAMGTSAYNPDMIPPITLGMPGLPAGVANTFVPGFFQPNWNFMYDHETKISSKFYTGDGGLRIGGNIPITGMKELYLKKIFAVNGVDKGLNPIGDLVGGLEPDQFKIIMEASKSSDFESYVGGSFSLNEMQLRASYNRYITSSLWEPIANPANWVNSHWGALANNACPEPVKTAVCSYIWTQGLSIDPKKDDVLALVSYLVTMGVYYTIGYQYKVRIHWLDGIDKSPTGSPDTTDATLSGGVATDKSIANKYFTWVADIILRTVNKGVSESIGVKLRKRRVDEANLIYKHVGLSVVEYGTAVNNLPLEHQIGALRSRGFGKVATTGFKFYRYNNENPAGGEGAKQEIAEPTNVKAILSIAPDADPAPLTNELKTYIRTLMDKAGVKSATVSSTMRTSVAQVNAMYGNLRSQGNSLKYGAGGRAVIAQYYANQGKGESTVKSAMVDTCNAQPPYKVSRHCGDFDTRLAIDIGPRSIQPQSARGAFDAVLRAEINNATDANRVILKVLTPVDKDPAFHVEFDPRKIAGYKVHQNAEPPTVEFTLSNTTLGKEDAWNAPLSSDYLTSNSSEPI